MAEEGLAANSTAAAANQEAVVIHPTASKQQQKRVQVESRTVISSRNVTGLILRVRTLVQEWLSVEVEEESLTSAEGLLTEEAVDTFLAAGGDLGDVVPFALLEARKTFKRQVDDGDDGNLNDLRALACEILARRVVALIEANTTSNTGQHSHVSLSKRFVRLEEDGDEAQPSSALESAVDQNCVYFLSGPEAQRCAEEIWQGKLVQKFGEHRNVFFEPHHINDASFISRINPSRLSVPQYAYYSGLAIHIAFIVIYTFSTLEFTGLDAWEIVLWIFAAGYLVDDLTRWFKMGGLDKVISFWVLVDLCSDILFVAAFSVRITGWIEGKDAEKAYHYRLLAFQLLSCIAPLLWMQLLKLADGLQYFGVIQIVLLRMIKEAAAFFLLLLITAVGYAQSLFALDAADGHRVKGSVSVISNLLIQAILGQPDFEGPNKKFGAPFGTIIFYFYTFITVMLLANILVAFFASAYDKTVDAADSVFKAYFCSKVIASVRAPDQYVYLAPFNLLEAFLIAPFEPILPRKVYATINKYVQGVIFFIPLIVIAFYESNWQGSAAHRIYLEMIDDMPEERVRKLANVSGISNVKDPVIEGEEQQENAVISRTPFKQLASKLPSVKSGSEEKEESNGDQTVSNTDLAALMSELKALRSEIAALKK
ncbi:uncharacterized protein FA14DRAFT_192668 [Meira miltonrushii]|uniref:Ion transport domain-containing protein n=1 Tax=Meira miltonrushii TaxID=1280837 RepID=A0A316V207_9BASI|nr:uncharacterized protein FA14DRAFT_192668 [Meira miltonrushii]PWN31576.1 hypothetical protein FA14DRAFT_192668 [Meira miltonrushii]